MAKHVPMVAKKFNSDYQAKMGQNYTKEAFKLLERVHASQDPVMFTFLHDPVNRFLSSLGQVLNGPKRLLHQHLSPCHSRLRTHDLIDCVLSKIEETGSYLDAHFTPQSFELYIGLMGLDIPVHVIDLSHLSTVVEQLGGSRNHTHENSATGIVESYPQFYLTPAALTEDFPRRVCQLYLPDVLMLQQTKTTSTICPRVP